MGGLFGVASTSDCVQHLFYGTDYHCHLGTRRGGLAVDNQGNIDRVIHDITNSQFRSKFEDDVLRLHGNLGIGVISDYEDQPLIIGSHLGVFALATVGAIRNADRLAADAYRRRGVHFSEMSGNEINATELVATLIAEGEDFPSAIREAERRIEGSCSLLILTHDAVYAARDRFGRTPLIVGQGEHGYAVTGETCAFANLDYTPVHELGPGEVVRITADAIETLVEPADALQICSFLYVYYGYPASSYEGVNVEESRYRCGCALAERDDVEVDLVSGIPDSGTGHALGYAHGSGVPFKRPFVKYTPTWPRSFMPQDQSVRDLVARMKLIPIPELTRGSRMLFCDDSIVRGTQLKNTFGRLFDSGAEEIHLRIACPPLLFGCPYLNFSRSRSEDELAARRAIREIEGEGRLTEELLARYADPSGDEHRGMVESIRRRLSITSLRYQRLPDMIEAIGLPAEHLCTYCWSGT